MMEERLLKKRRVSGRMLALYGVLAMYLATWIWGIPATHTAIAQTTIRDYKDAARLVPDDVGPHHPHLQVGASYAILPLVIVNHYDYQIGGVIGWGGFTIDVWYFAGIITIGRCTKWIS